MPLALEYGNGCASMHAAISVTLFVAEHRSAWQSREYVMDIGLGLGISCRNLRCEVCLQDEALECSSYRRRGVRGGGTMVIGPVGCCFGMSLAQQLL